MPGKSTLPVPFGASNKLPLVFVVAIVLASKLKLSVVTLPVPCGVSAVSYTHLTLPTNREV